MEDNFLEIIELQAQEALEFIQLPTEVMIAVDSVSVAEDGDKTLEYTFTRTDNDISNALTVNFTVSGSATFDTDYRQEGAEEFDATTGKVTIAAGETTATVTITPVADTEIESDETVKLTLAAGSNYILDADESEMVMSAIANDDTQLNVDWAKNLGGYKYITLDEKKNTYVAGRFAERATIGDKTLTAEDNFDIYVAKVDKDGNINWAEAFGGKEYEAPKDIAVDDSGNTYITGTFDREIIFGNTTLDAGRLNDVFVSKLDDKGNVVWAKNFGNSGNDYGYAIDVDDDDNIYIAGTFEDNIQFGNITLDSADDFSNVFVTKLDSKGDVLWAKDFGISSDKAEKIIVDNEGNSYLFMTGGEASNRISVAKLDNNGKYKMEKEL